MTDNVKITSDYQLRVLNVFKEKLFFNLTSKKWFTFELCNTIG
jgi:hypothetical protein